MNWLKRLPAFVEFVLVIAIAFGVFIAVAIRDLLRPAPRAPWEASPNQLALTLSVELLAFGIVLIFLNARGWPLRSVTLRPTLKGTLVGASLFLWMFVIYFVVYIGIAVPSGAGPEASRLPYISPSPVAIAFTLVNPFFEECIANAYVAHYARRYGGVAVVLASTTLRLSYHLYQGWVAIPVTIACGLVLGGYYWARRDLWPPIVAHLLANGLALLYPQ